MAMAASPAGRENLTCKCRVGSTMARTWNEGSSETVGKPTGAAENVRELIEAALERFAGSATAAVDTETGLVVAPAGVSSPAPASAVVVGEVMDTHHPHLPGRVLVRWLDTQGALVERWVPRERHLSLHPSDHVLLTLPVGWTEWVVTGALGRESTPRQDDEQSTLKLDLEPGQAVRIVAHDGQTLLTVRQGADGPTLELGAGDVDLVAARRLRLRGDSVEITAASGGVDLRSEGDAVVRARTIRLN